MPDRDRAMEILLRQALEHRERAEELRMVAETISNPSARAQLLDMAKAGDRLASDIEARLARLRDQDPD